MSKEIIEDYIDAVIEHEQGEFPEILEGIIEYGFIDDVQLANLLDVELDDIDELLISAEDLDSKTWKSYKSKIKAFLVKEKKKYERLYYSSKLTK